MVARDVVVAGRVRLNDGGQRENECEAAKEREGELAGLRAEHCRRGMRCVVCGVEVVYSLRQTAVPSAGGWARGRLWAQRGCQSRFTMRPKGAQNRRKVRSRTELHPHLRRTGNEQSAAA